MSLSRILSAIFGNAQGTPAPSDNLPAPPTESGAAQERKALETYEPFMAQIDSIKPVTRNDVKAYEMILLVDNVPHLVPAVLIESLQEYSDTRFEDLQKGDTVRVGAIGSSMQYYVPQTIIGTIEKYPPGTSLENIGPVGLGYTSRSIRPSTPDNF